MNPCKLFIVIATILVASACAPIAASPIPPLDVTMPPTVTPILLSTSGPTQILATLEAAWKTYHSDNYGFSFQYPSVYDEAQYQTCAVKVVEQPDGTRFSLGHQSFLDIQWMGDVDIRAYVDELIERKQAEEAWAVELQKTRVVGGEDSIEINYRFGGVNRFGTATFLKHKDLLLTFNFYAGTFCDVSELNLVETQAYSQWINSLRFDP